MGTLCPAGQCTLAAPSLDLHCTPVKMVGMWPLEGTLATRPQGPNTLIKNFNFALLSLSYYEPCFLWGDMCLNNIFI